MKSASRTPIYFSAYPLKVLQNVADSSDKPASPQLKALLSNTNSNKKTIGRFRISPMADPYRKVANSTTKRPAPSKIVDPEGREWFTNYE